MFNIFKIRTEKNIAGDMCDWRWDLEFDKYGFIVSELVRGVGDTGEERSKWRQGTRYFSFHFTSWRLGRFHEYYDGPHDALALGFVIFGWSQLMSKVL